MKMIMCVYADDEEGDDDFAILESELCIPQISPNIPVECDATPHSKPLTVQTTTHTLFNSASKCNCW